MIPLFDSDSGNLPPGIDEATWDEVLERFGHTPHRATLLAGLASARSVLQTVGCGRAYLDGSFVSNKEVPGDFDVCWEIEGVDLPSLVLRAPEVFDLRRDRRQQQRRYGGELIPVDSSTGSEDLFGVSILDLFQRDKHTGAPKGIILIRLGGQ